MLATPKCRRTKSTSSASGFASRKSKRHHVKLGESYCERSYLVAVPAIVAPEQQGTSQKLASMGFQARLRACKLPLPCDAMTRQMTRRTRQANVASGARGMRASQQRTGAMQWLVL
jgi:hypothetical protein